VTVPMRVYAVCAAMILTIVLSQGGCAGRSIAPTKAPSQPTATVGAPTAPTATPVPTAANPTVAISPTTGPPGTRVQVVGRGFPADVEVELGAGRQDSEYDVVDVARTTADGELDASLNIPAFAEPEEQWVVAAAVPDGGAKGVSNAFHVTGSQGEPTVEVSRRTLSPGGEVEVSARGFPPDAGVELGIGRVNSEYDVVTNASTDAAGTIATSLTIPEFVEPGDRWVIVVATQDHSVKAVSPVLQVAEGLFTRTSIHLIAVGDEGRSGPEIGCGDSVVPVEIEIEPTVAPLTAALERLLSLDSREYGASGLYNTLYQSDLSLEGVNIVEGQAIIRLAGTLTLGGVCDAPRVKAQLRETALQYVTVDRVSIFVNGTPLDALLGEKGERDDGT